MYRYLEAVGGSLASNTLLADTGHHLGNVDGGPLAATLAHVQGAVVPMQRVHAYLHHLTLCCSSLILSDLMPGPL